MAASLTQSHSQPSGLEQSARTYHGVLIALRYVVLHFVVIATFLILAFCTPASMLTAFVVALIELGVGLVLAQDRRRPSWLSEASTLFISTSFDSGHGAPAARRPARRRKT